MSYLSIEGGAPLHGELTIQGSKNSVLPVLAATILARDVCRIENCPRLRDVAKTHRGDTAPDCDAQGHSTHVKTRLPYCYHSTSYNFIRFYP